MLTICHWPGHCWKYLKIISCLTEHTAHITIMSACSTFTPMQDEISSTNLALKHMKSSQIHIWSAKRKPHQTGLLWFRPSRAKPRPASPNHVRSALFWYYTVQSSNSAPMFQDNLSVPKKEQSLREEMWRNLLVWNLVHCLISWMCTEFWKPAPFLLSGKEVPNLVEPLDLFILNHWAPQKQQPVTLCTWEQI